MDEVMVSAVIPVYNCEDYLRKCVQSVLQQTYRALEIILVDDGSLDGSAFICDECAQSDLRVKVIHQANSGAAAARKTGIEHASGTYIMFVDADDWLDSDYVEKLLMPTTDNNPDVVIGTMRNCQENGHITEQHPYFPCGYYSENQLHKKIFPQMLSAMPYHTFGVFPSMCGKLFRAEIVKQNLDALDTGITFGEDGCFTYSALLDCKSMYITDVCGYNYRTNMASVTHRFDRRLLQDGKRLLAFYNQLSCKKGWDPGTQIDEYMAFVCNHTVTQAITTRNAVGRRDKIALRTYIRETLPKSILKNKKISKCGLKTKIRFVLLKLRAVQMLAMIIHT